MNRRFLKRIFFILFLTFTVTLWLSGAEPAGPDKRLSVLGGFGVSSARGDYPSEFDARSDFSFTPGVRLKVEELLLEESYFFFDLGYLETGFVGYVSPTDTYFYNTYTYLNLNVMIGKLYQKLYYAGGIYLGIGLDAYSYKEYEDKWGSFDPNNDFGIVVEVGADITTFLSLGVQGRYGLTSIGSKVDIKNQGILGTISFHVLRF